MRAIRGRLASMIFQEPMTSLNPVFTIGNQVVEAVRLHTGMGRAEAREIALEYLEKVGIPAARERMDQYPHQLSGGMKQRVMIAMALCLKPALLIADEPTTALDVTIQAGILRLMKDMQEETGAAILLITHDLGVIAEMADDVAVMYAGKSSKKGPARRSSPRSSTPTRKGFFRSLPGRSAEGPEALHHRGHRAFGAPVPGRLLPVQSALSPRDRAVQGRGAAPGRRWRRPPLRLLGRARRGRAPMMLEVKDLRMYFPVKRGFFRRTAGYVEAVDGVNLTVDRGETVGLVGESGCGKTTVSKCVVRLLQVPRAGSILFDGRDIASISPKELKAYRRRMQMVFQDPFGSLNPRMTVSDILGEGPVVMGEDEI